MTPQIRYFLISLFFMLNSIALFSQSSNLSKPSKIYSMKHNNKLEVLKIYGDSAYEHLRYLTKRGFKELKINKGKIFKVWNGILMMTPENKEFNSMLYNRKLYVSKNIYLNYKDNYFSRSYPILKKQKAKSFYTPSIIHPVSNELVVYNGDCSVSVEEIANHITKGIYSDRDKTLAIGNFVINNLKYDYNYYHGRARKIHNQYDAEKILKSKYKIVVCTGYAHIFNEFAKHSGLKSKEIAGFTKTTQSDINTSQGYHAWNMVWINGNPKLFDFTWSDYNDSTWLDVDPAIMIYSHFPDYKEDQLLNHPITKAKWLSLPVYLPRNKQERVISNFQDGITYSDSTTEITFPNNYKLDAYSLDNNSFYSYYRGGNNPKLNRAEKLDYKQIKVSEDSTIYSIPLNKNVSLIDLYVNSDVDKAYIQFIAVKGDFNTLLQFHVEKSTNELFEPMVMGIISSIRLNDIENLKKLTSDTCSVLFDKRGNLNLKNEIMEEINKWKGERKKQYYYTTEKGTTYMELTDKLKIHLKKENNKFILEKFSISTNRI